MLADRLGCSNGIEGVYRRRQKGCTRRDPEATLSDDLVKRRFHPSGPDRFWVADITEHSTKESKIYCAVVVDAWSRRVLAGPLLIISVPSSCDALDMTIFRYRPEQGAGLIHHADHSIQYTSWTFGQRLRKAGLLGSMGTVGVALDNAMAESFCGTLQLELLDRRTWETRRELAQAIFEYIEVFYSPDRRRWRIMDLVAIRPRPRTALEVQVSRRWDPVTFGFDDGGSPAWLELADA